MSKTALVLSGGGGKGAFQAGAEAYCRERGFRWDLISGVSIGALNGCFVSMGDYDTLRETWFSISPSKVYGPRAALNAARRLYRRRRSLFPLTGISNSVDMIDLARMKVPTRVGAVSLITGEFKMFDNAHPAFKNAVMASCALPLVFPPVDVDEQNPCMADGGTRNLAPLSSVLGDLPDRIVVINCSSRESLRAPQPPRTALAVSLRAFDIAMHEIYHKDIDKTLRINRLVAQATAAGVQLTNTAGRPFRHFDVTVIEPDCYIGDVAEYSPERSRKNYELGWERARRVLG